MTLVDVDATPVREQVDRGGPHHGVRLATVAAVLVAGSALASANALHGDRSASGWSGALLVVALLLGLPHGAADAFSPVLRRGGLLHWGVRLAGYAAVPGVVLAAWSRWPAPVLVVLLIVAALHFGLGDAELLPRRLASVGAGPVLTGVIPVAVPIGLHGKDIAGLLDALSGGQGAAIGSVCRVVSVVAAAGCVIHLLAALRRRDALSGAEPLVLFALFALLRPLAAFAVYYGLWHCARQMSVTLTGIRQRQSVGLARAWAVFAATAALPTIVAVVVLATALPRLGVTTGSLIAVLALTVPHGVVAYRESHAGPLCSDDSTSRFSRLNKPLRTRGPIADRIT